MAYTFLVQFLIYLFLTGGVFARVDRVHSEGYLGEKSLDSYAERYRPLIFQDLYRGRISFQDEIFFQNYFQPYLFTPEKDVSFFLRSELNAGMICPNELLSEHFDEIRYSYRLITLSYLIEAQWQMKLAGDHFRLRPSCDFKLEAWAKNCHPKSPEMKKFVERLLKIRPRFDEKLPATHTKADWWREFSSGKPQSYPQYRMSYECKGRCTESDMGPKFQAICRSNQEVMDLICSEMDELYGLSNQRDAYYLLGQSNIINTYNKKGEAMGCLRRFSEVLAHKEVKYPALNQLFPVLQSHLRSKYFERFLQGRVFFLGAGKEYEKKGLADLYVSDQTLKVETLKKVEDGPVVAATKVEVKPEVKKVIEPVKVVAAEKKKTIVEIAKPIKSAFLQAAELRRAENLEQMEVDMLKLKYDYVFTLNMMNTLSDRLKTFMTREALSEMMNYDKLGSKEGPVPLLFIKFMIDFEEHHGLWNMISVLGDKFYVSNEIDSSFKPEPELVQLVNNENTGRQWQLIVLRP